jgi:hypothetical protein
MNKSQLDPTSQRLLWGGIVLLIMGFLTRYATFGGNLLKAIPFDVIGFVLLGIGLYRILKADKRSSKT